MSASVAATVPDKLDVATITASTYTLAKQGSSTPVAATLSYLVCGNVVLAPAAPLEPGTTYTARLKGGASGVKDLAGNPLAVDKVWSFTTAPRAAP